jgi:ATP-dependent DNA helicase RecG
MLAAGELKKANQSVPARSVKFKKEAAQQFVSSLPFNLTDDQRRAVWQIYKDIERTEPMNRLVEGDVGSGKTVVAAMAALMVIESDMQVALIAPTELLAKQHYQTFNKVFSHTTYIDRLELLTGSLKAKEKAAVKERIASGQASCIIGTHSLIQPTVNWHSLGLVIVDEQHRFGVKQRQSLQTKTGYMPHILNMTATPIPRSLALTVYGELDITIISQAPSNKAGVDTELISPNSTAQMYGKIKSQLDDGRQAYVVCPLITESEVLNFASAEETYKNLTQKELKDYKVGLLHGGLPANQKENVMKDFKDGKLDAVVATTVIEVGVDVPNATEMAILGADRFGLAQLHQLRGRVGRGEHKGTCYLVMSDSAKPSRRMRAIESTNNGFELAEYDLELRGPGAIYGTRQHGELDLRFVSLTDHVLISEVRQAVNLFIDSGESVIKYQRLNKQVKHALKLTYLN